MKMKNLSIILVVCFAVFQLGTADKVARECLVENGLKESDINLLAAVGKRDFPDVEMIVSKDKIACVLACIFKKENPEQSLNDMIKDVISKSTDKTEDVRKDMLETLSTCKIQAADDDCKLLQCIKVTELPFFDVLYSVVVTREMNMCFVSNGLKVSDAQYLDKMATPESSPEAIQEVLKIVDEDKLACAMSCMYDKQEKISPDQKLENSFEARINKSEKFTDDQKTKMRETLNKCATEAAGNNCKLVKCIKILRPPFLNLYTKA